LGIKIEGTGRYLPTKILTNNDLEKIVETSDEWIDSRTGIKERRIVSDNETTSFLAYQSALQAIKNSGVDKEEIDIVIVATFTPDYYTPSIACLVLEQLEVERTDVLAFDLNAACSGFVYALNVAERLLAGKENKKALIIGAEVISNVIDWKDRNTCVLFGDGSGAVVLSYKKDNLFYQTHGASGDRLALSSKSAIQHQSNTPTYLKMNGQAVFKFASQVVQKSIQELLDQSRFNLEEIDYVVCHQANSRIIKHAYQSFKADPKQFYLNIEHYGNTSAASIPIALAEMNEQKLLKKGNKIILVGFGAGLAWGAILLEW
jgi:3-oxoacyl-(acyl-carrier-protein) synthase III